MREEKKPFFSVIVPVYNKEPHIARSINSVLNQTFQDFEIVIVCDPSTDNSNAEVAKFTDPRIRVFHRDEPGPGGYAARNLGIKNAKADWIAFLDADDEWYPEHLKLFQKAIADNPTIQLFTSGWLTKGVKETDNKFYKLNSSSKLLSAYDYFFSVLKNNNPIWTSVVCMYKNLAINSGMFPEGKIAMGGDMDFWTRAVLLAKELFYIHELTAVYHTDSVNMVTKTSHINPKLHFDNTNKHLSSLNNDDELIPLIKKVSNKLVSHAWTNNMRVATGNNFNFSAYIFKDVLIFKQKIILVMSYLPVQIQKILVFLGSKVMNLIRGLK